MKTKIYLLVLLAFAATVSGCKKDPIGVYPVPDKGPDITDLVVHNNSSVLEVPGEVTYSLKLADKYTLSNLTVSIEMGDVVLASERRVIYESGTSYSVTDGKLVVPFAPNMAEGAPVTVKVTAFNVPGGESTESTTLNLKRPAISDVYMFLDVTKAGVKLTQDAENKSLYRSAKGSYASEFEVIFANADKLDDATLIWVADSEDSSLGAIGDMEAGKPINGYFPTTIVDEINFNVLTFKPGVDGEKIELSINNVDMGVKDRMLYARVAFTKDAEVPFSGFSNMLNAFNPDFFTYDEDTEKLTYIRESDTWDVYYSMKLNYLWVRKDAAVGPEAYWVVGHGFIAAPDITRWNASGMRGGGWEPEVFLANAYIVKTAEKRYQTSIYITNEHDWGGFEFQFYSDLEWGKDAGFSLEGTTLTGDTAGFEINAKPGDGGLNSTDDFVPGFYRLEFDLSGSSPQCNIVRLGDGAPLLPDVFIDGTKLTQSGLSLFGTFTFTKDAAVTVSGIDNLEDACNRDMFSYEGGTLTFIRESGEYQFVYHADANYIQAFDESKASPDAMWAGGQLFCNAPAWNSSIAAGWGSPRTYIVKTAENKYRMTVFCQTSEGEDDDEMMIAFYKGNTGWDEGFFKLSSSAFTGPAAAHFEIGSEGEEDNYITWADKITGPAGFYTFEFDTSNPEKTAVTISSAE